MVVAVGICALSGCAHRGDLDIELRGDVSVSDRPVLILFADGVRADLVDEMMQAGELENIKRYIYDRGCKVRYAVSSLPTITYAVTASMTTGRFPGHHHIMGNKWFDRNYGKFQDYMFIRTYQQVDRDLRAPTIFEILDDKYTVSIQVANRRGAVRPIDNWMTSGINWFFNRILTVDQLTAVRFELIADEANRTGRWPGLVLAYFPAVDEVGHRYGADSRQYRRALVNLDVQIGRICGGLERAGLLDRYYIFFVSDHGHVPARKERYWVPADFLRKELPGVGVVDAMFLEKGNSTKWHEYLNSKCRFVVVTGGNRRSHIHVRPGRFWHERPSYDQVASWFGKEYASRQSSRFDGTLAELLAAESAVRVAAEAYDEDRVRICSRDAIAIVERQRRAGCKVYRYQLIEGDPLGYSDDESTRRLIDGGFHTGDRWLAASCGGEFPDFVPQIVEMFDSPRAGQIVLFADRGWDFSTDDLGGHGSALKDDMIVPFVVVGPDIRAGEIPTARLVDIVPTVLDMIGCSERLKRIGPIDGKSLLGQLRDH